MTNRCRLVIFFVVVLAHGVVLGGLLNLRAPQRLVVPPTPLSAHLIPMPAVATDVTPRVPPPPPPQVEAIPVPVKPVISKPSKPRPVVKAQEVSKRQMPAQPSELTSELTQKSGPPPTPVPTASRPEPAREPVDAIGDAQPAAEHPLAAPAPPPAPSPVRPPRVDATQHNNPPPIYPAVARRRGEQGRVVLALLIKADGHVEELDVHTSSGFPRLDQAALNAVRQWRYTPAMRAGVAIDYHYLQPVTFTLSR